MKPDLSDMAREAGQIPARPRYPVALLHGVGVAAERFNSRGFEPIAAFLTRHGIAACAPPAPPYAPVAARAKLRYGQILDFLDVTGADKVNIVAFSGGGLDARYLVSRLGGNAFVASLTTVSTPHRGTSLAALFVRSDQRSRGAISAVMRYLAKSAPWPQPPDPFTTLGEITPEHVSVDFNARVCDAPDVMYFSMAGSAGKGTRSSISPALYPMNAWLYRREGANDGLVSVNSARWGTFWGTVKADHAELFGIRLRRRSFNYVAFYASIVTRLAEIGL